jgi:hypothetical protein
MASDGLPGADNTDGKFDPENNKQGRYRKPSRDAIPEGWHQSRRNLEGKAGSYEHAAEDDKVGSIPFHFVGEVHRYSWRQ